MLDVGTKSPNAPDEHETHRLKEAHWVPQRWGTARMTPRRIQNYVTAHLERTDGKSTLSSLPLKLTIESTNICNLRCAACPTGLERRGRRVGHMSVELFSWLMSELGPTLFEVELHNWGEPLIGKNVFEFIALARAAGVSSTISTNFSLELDDREIERIVESGLSVLGASIDGATQEVYEKYRIRGNLALVLENCRRLAAAKRRLGSSTPELFFSYHVFGHNVHEVEVARSIAADIGMNFEATRAWVVGEEAPGLEQFPYIWGEGYPDRCSFLWFQTVVHHEGGVAPCCATFYAEDDFDRVSADDLGRKSFRDIWNGDNFVRARRLFDAHDGDAETRKLVCFDCPETLDFDRWKQAIRTQSKDFRRTSSNAMYNFFLNRVPGQRSDLVRLRGRNGSS